MTKFEKDLTSGSVVKKLILFALPFMLSNFIQSMYNIADMFIVGRFMGKTGISGVSIGGQLMMIMTNAAVAICTGGAIIIGQFIGAKERCNAVKTIATLLTFLLGIAVFLTVLMLFASDKILYLIKTPPESYEYAKQYLSITILGSTFIFGYNSLSAIMRGMGNSKTPLYLVSGACIINILLDLLFVGMLDMGVRGAATATVISQAFSMSACIYFLMNTDFMFDFRPSSFKIYRDKLKLILSTGLPILIQSLAMSFSFLMMTVISNTLGVTASAGLAIVAKFNGFALMPTMAVGASVSAMVAQNMGANQIERVKKTMHAGLGICFVVSVPIYIFAQFFSATFISLFDKDADLIIAGVEYLKYFSFDYLIMAFFSPVISLIIGSGHTKFSSFLAICSSVLIRLPLAYFFVMVMNLNLAGIGLSAPIANSLATIAAWIYYSSGRWKEKIITKKVIPST